MSIDLRIPLAVAFGALTAAGPAMGESDSGEPVCRDYGLGQCAEERPLQGNAPGLRPENNADTKGTTAREQRKALEESRQRRDDLLDRSTSLNKAEENRDLSRSIRRRTP